MKVLVVVDMQNDFISGALGTEEAKAIVPKVVAKIQSFEGSVICTRDTHGKNYLGTQEGRNLRVAHCIKGSDGWLLHPQIATLAGEVIDKPTFGSVELGQRLKGMGAEEVILVGLCTDICVISNALLIKAFLPEVPIKVVADCCAGTTVENHERALEAMKACQIEVVE